MDPLLNTREWAIVTLFVLAALWVLVGSATRPALRTVLRAMATWKIVVPLLGVICWVAVLVIGAHRVGLWNASLAKDTVAWLLASAAATVFAALRAAESDDYFRRAAKQAVGAAAFFVYAMNLYTFNYFVELVLQVALIFLVGLQVVVQRRDTSRAMQRAVTVLGLIVVVPFVLFTLRGVIRIWSSLDPQQIWLGLGLSIWLPLAVLPYVWALALAMSYEQLMLRMRSPVFGNDAPARTRLLAAVALGLDLRAVHDLSASPKELREISAARGWREVSDAAHVYRRRRARRRAAPLLEAQRLARFAGALGTDADGRQLDQREMKETRAALEWMANCHMGHFRNLGFYREDLMEVLGDFRRQGLPEDHGVEVRVIASGGQWYAWRRTPSGLILGVGAGGPPPDQWFYAAREAPVGPPAASTGWEQWASTAPDWNG